MKTAPRVSICPAAQEKTRQEGSYEIFFCPARSRVPLFLHPTGRPHHIEPRGRRSLRRVLAREVLPLSLHVQGLLCERRPFSLGISPLKRPSLLRLCARCVRTRGIPLSLRLQARRRLQFLPQQDLPRRGVRRDRGQLPVLGSQPLLRRRRQGLSLLGLFQLNARLRRRARRKYHAPQGGADRASRGQAARHRLRALRRRSPFRS